LQHALHVQPLAAFRTLIDSWDTLYIRVSQQLHHMLTQAWTVTERVCASYILNQCQCVWHALSVDRASKSTLLHL